MRTGCGPRRADRVAHVRAEGRRQGRVPLLPVPKVRNGLPSKAGDLYITLSTWQAYNPVEGSVIVRMETPRRAIKGAQLDAIKEVYDATCASRLAPADWSSDEYPQ